MFKQKRVKIIFSIFFIMNLLAVLFFIFKIYPYWFHSDSATVNLLVQEQIRSGSFFPKAWAYGPEIWVLSLLDIFMLPLSYIIDDQLKLRAAAVVIQVILLLLTIYFMDRCIFKNEMWFLTSILLMTFFSREYFECMYGQATYGTIVVLNCLLLSLIAKFINHNYWKYSILISLLIFGMCASGIRALMTVLIPFIFAYYFVKFTNRNEYYHFEFNLKILPPVIAAICGLIINKYLLATHISVSGINEPVFLGSHDINLIFSNIKMSISAIMAEFGLDVSRYLFSIDGVIFLLKISLLLIILFILPFFIYRQYQRFDVNIKVLLVYLIAIWVETILISTFIMYFNSPRYFFWPFVFLLIIESWFITEHLSLKKSFVFIVSSLFLINMFFAYEAKQDWRKFASDGINKSQSVEEIKNIGNIMTENHVKIVYATYWNAAKYTVMLNNKITFLSILPIDESSMIKEGYYLISRNSYANAADIPSALMLSKDENKLFEKNILMLGILGNPENKINIGDYIIYVYKTNILYKMLDHLDISKSAMNIKPYMYIRAEKDNKLISMLNKLPNQFLMYGPYATYEKGDYEISIDMQDCSEENLKENNEMLKITKDKGKVVISSANLHPGINKVQFHIDGKANNVEFVFRNHIKGLQIGEMSIKKIRG